MNQEQLFLVLILIASVLAVLLLVYFISQRPDNFVLKTLHIKDPQRIEFEKKKEQAKELYYRKLYEEVTRFNISTENLDYEALQLLADSHGKIGNKKDAIQLYDIAFKRAENFEEDFEKATIIKDKAMTLYGLSAFEETIETLREYPNENLNHDIDQNDFSVIGMLGNCFMQLGKFDAAIETFRRGIDNKHVTLPILFGIARAFQAKKDPHSLEHALKYFMKVYERDDTFENVKQSIDSIKAELKLDNPSDSSNTETMAS
ncbi:MAG TPA: hypothetical protein DCM08_07320 [Microscillaceae bacterium]|jgi:tetratricopeptide (TPR) repeat protein|nr:hypothetical protein [Microscillaceae bacterium]